MNVGDYVRTENGIDKVAGYRYEPEYEKQENIIVDIIEVVKTGDNIIIIAVIGVVSLLVLIVAIIMSVLTIYSLSYLK